MITLNIIYFIIITSIAVWMLLSRGAILQNPLRQGAQIGVTGPELFWIFTFSTGLLALSAYVGIDLMAIRLGVLELLLTIGLIVVRERPVLSMPLIIYLCFMSWIGIGIIYSGSLSYGVRTWLKYLYPLLIALFASTVVNDIEVWLKAGIGARAVALVSLLFKMVPYIGLLVPGVFWYDTALAINYISIMVFSLALAAFTDQKMRNQLYSVIFMLPCFVWVFRTSIVGTFVALGSYFFIRYRIKSLPVIVGLVIIGVGVVFYVPSINSKMFKNGQKVTIEQLQRGDLSFDDIETNARSAMWAHLENRFFNHSQLVGSGTGSVQQYMYNNHVFNGLIVPHSDFVQLRCDNGLVGLVLYIAAILAVICHSTWVYWHDKDVSVRLAAIVAAASMSGVFVTLYSDNVVNYSMATLSMPFGFYGMLLGLIKRRYETIAGT